MDSDEDDGAFNTSPAKVIRGKAAKKPTAGVRGKKAATAAKSSPLTVVSLANGAAKHPLASARLPVPVKKPAPVVAGSSAAQTSVSAAQPAGQLVVMCSDRDRLSSDLDFE